MILLHAGLLFAQESSSSTPLRWVRKNISSANSTAQPSSDAAQAPQQQATDASPETDAPATALRWRTPPARAQVSSAGATAPIKIATVSSSGLERGQVLQALATAPAIPYSKPKASEAPLGAASQTRVPPQELSRGNGDESMMIDLVAQVQEDASPIEPQGVEPQGAEPASPNDLSQDDLPPAPQTLPEPAPPSSSKQPSSPSTTKCDRIYNERDCCEDDERCHSARRLWNRDALAKISLDITPQLRPDETDPYAEESQRNADLSKAPVRTWRDRQGNVVVTGRLNNIQRGRLLVLDENNQIIKVPFRELSDDDLCFVTAWWRVPTECTFGDEAYLARNWQPSTLTWKASGVCHKPLYFEEPQLERYGHTTGHFKQPLLSGAHFFLNLVALPYNAGINPPWECQYPLGYYRPGSCAPWLVPPVPLSVRGALWEAGAIAGGIALLP